MLENTCEVMGNAEGISHQSGEYVHTPGEVSSAVRNPCCRKADMKLAWVGAGCRAGAGFGVPCGAEDDAVKDSLWEAFSKYTCPGGAEGR